MKKKLLSFIFAICLIIPAAFMLSACGTKEKESTPPEEPTTSIGLEYELINNDAEYAVKGIGTYGNQSNIDIPSTHNNKPVTAIGEEAFKNCDNLEGVTIPTNITSIGDWAFYDCDALLSINISNGVVSVGNRAFSACDELLSVVFGNNVETIGDYAFDGCVKLESITWGDDITTIGGGAFASCDALESVSIPNSVNSIGEEAFWDCDKLKTVTIGSGITVISRSLFGACDVLENVVIGSNVATISSAAFANAGLQTVIIPSTVTTIATAAFRCGLDIVTIDSESISNNLVEEDSQGDLALNAETIYIKSGLRVTNSTFLLESFTKQATSDKTGYDMYVRNAE